MATIYRQGDVLLITTDQIPPGLTSVPRDRGRVVLAYGEATGHAHAISEPGAELLSDAEVDRRFLVLAAQAVLTHPEHAPITLPAGSYQVRRQREYTPEAVRPVAD